MAKKRLSDEQLEQYLGEFFQAQVGGRRASPNLWARLAPRLQPPPAPRSLPMPLYRWLAPAFAAVLLLLVGVSMAWLFTSPPWRAGVPAAPGPQPVEIETIKPPGTLPAGAPTPTPAPAIVPERAKTDVDTGAPAPSGVLETAQRQVIMTASLALEVPSVESAAAQARAIAEGLGGFVQQMSFLGGKDKERQQATMTLRVPQEQVFTALERLRALGTVVTQTLGSQDVTEQMIDLDARLRALQRQEQSLLNLLGRAQSVGDILTIERELSRVRGEIERLQGQMRALERRVEMATITLNLTAPPREVGTPPSASLGIEVPRVSQSVGQVKALVASRKGAVDSIVLSVQDGQERADISLRVFRQDFPGVLDALESLGKVRHKEVREGATPKDGAPPQEPDAPITLTLTTRPGWWTLGKALAIALPVGGVLLLALGALALRRRRAV
ncbi:MAG: DUF4349 domain-containing protein [Dehalococcoidia bacterium]